MDLKCLHCENEFEGAISKDEFGWHSVCDDCGSSFDVDVPEGRIVVAFTNPDYDSAEPYKSFEQEKPEENICAYYAFDTPKAFLEKWRELVNDPDGMWYWVLDGNDCICSGACDPGDIEIFEEHFGLEGLFSASIANLTLSTQAFKCLVYGGRRVDTIGKLFELSDEELLGIDGLGPKRFAEIKEAFWAFWNSFEGFASKQDFGDVVEQLKDAVALEYKGILFDNWQVDEEHEGVWAEMCQSCVDKHKDLLTDELSDGGIGACGVKDCNVVGMDSDYERHYYVDFKLELIQALDITKFMERYPELADLDSKLLTARMRFKEEDVLNGLDRSSWEFFK